ncbi:MAG: Xaa-Pro aminopeptidase [Gemmatimonadaceae bacterium]
MIHGRRLLLALVPMLWPVAGRAQVTAAEYAQRRAAFAAKLEDGVFVARGGEEPVQDYLSFFQSPGFLYLTGYKEAGASLLMTKSGNAVSWTLFVEPKIPSVEVWSGKRNGTDGAQAMTGISARLTTQFDAQLDSALTSARRLYLLADIAESGDTLNNDQAFVARLTKAHQGLNIVSANPLVSQMRAKKSAAEMELIRRAAAISMDAHREAARALRPGMNEFEIQALLEYTFRRNGGDRPAYSSIVGSGANATTLHYNRDDRFMKPGELLLIDAAAQYGGYAADVTRTFPVSGTFTAEQRQVYGIVRAAQAAAERQAKVGASARLMSDSASRVLSEGLTRLGLIEAPGATYECGAADAPRKCSQLSLFYMHGLGHGIGLEVHDPEQYYFSGRVDVGSAFSIEPGIYVRENLLDIVPNTAGNAQYLSKLKASLPKYAGVGVRIEDNYIVTENGLEWVSCVPREADEVEAMMKDRANGPSARDAERVEWYRATGAAPAEVGKGAAAPKPRSCSLPKM